MNHTATSFNKSKRQNIKRIFEEKTGVDLTSRRTMRSPAAITAVLAVVLVCFLSLSAFAFGVFSSLAGDELSFSATYEGNGLVSVVVKNESDKNLVFQPALKLMLWSTGEEIAPVSHNVIFMGTKIPADSSGTMRIDLSGAYDIEMLEKPLSDDNYYFVLTNQNFIFGQDWMCTVRFSDSVTVVEGPLPPVQADERTLQAISESLQGYLMDITFEIEERRTLNAEYVQTYTELFKQFNGHIVSSVSPSSFLVDTPFDIVFDRSVSKEEQRFLVGQHWLSSDSNFKMLATETETALTISALLPSVKYTDAGTGTYLPLFYIFVYDKTEIDIEKDYAFIYGQVIDFSDLEKYKVYESEQYICYEASALIYTDLTEYIHRFVSLNSDVRHDEQAIKRVENIYNYYKENLCGSFLIR